MVKYLVIPSIESLNASLQRINLGDHSICGRLHCYSLKMVQKDKKLVKLLQKEYSNDKSVQQQSNVNDNNNNQQRRLSSNVNKSPKTSLEFSTIRLISYFISTLQNEYPDFDFTSTEPSQFQSEEPKIVNETITARLAPLEKSQPLLISKFWKNIDSVINLQQCEFYSYIANDDLLNVLRPHSLWNIDYFLVNLNEKKMIYLSLFAQNNLYNDDLSKKSSSDLAMEFKEDIPMDLDIDFDECEIVNDGMTWCDASEMSPHHSKNHKEENENMDLKMNDNCLRVVSNDNCLSAMQMPALESPN